MCKRKADNARYRCSVENFVLDEYSICREERQYAVFLYNILRKYGKKQAREKLTGEEKEHILKIWEACGIEADSDIEYVFYEATFMRDFFERERRYLAANKHNSNKMDAILLQKTYANDTKREDIGEDEAKSCFNHKLITYVHHGEAVTTNLLKRNLGHTQIEGDELSDREKELIKDMMNAKPDIAVIYRRRKEKDDKGKKYLLLIECKFESYEDSYRGENLSQCSVQYDVAKFLCDCYWNQNLAKTDPDYIAVSPLMEAAQKSRIVKFMRAEEKKRERGVKEARNVGRIFLKTLIDCDHNIFEEDTEKNR